MARLRRVVTARPWLSSGIAAVLVGGSIAAYFLTGSSNATAQDGTTTRLVAASIGDVSESVSATGTFAPADEEDVSFSSAAEVTSVRVAVGDKVKKGDVLGTIDDLSLRASLAEARSALASARATLAAAEESGTATDAQLAADRASVSTDRRSVSAAKTALKQAVLRSPITGTVAQVNVAKGDQATGSQPASDNNSGSDSSSPSSSSSSSSDPSSSADFVIIGLKKWTVSASVDDTEVGLVKKGQEVEITTADVTGKVFGVVSSVSVLSSSTSGSASYPVDIDVTGTPSGLHDGASATVDIIYRKVTNVLTVPTLAVHTASDGSSYVYVSSNGKKVRRTVTTGLSSAGTTQIKSGLRSGEQVYIEIAARTPSVSSSNGNVAPRQGNFPTGGVFLPGGGGGVPGGKIPNGGGS